MMITILVIVALCGAAIPAVVFLRNLNLYRSARTLPTVVPEATSPSISLLIPARNEVARIGPTLETALRSTGVDLEIIVLDDHSTDRTDELVESFAERDGRVRLEHCPPLLNGWNGKQHACHVLSQLATHEQIAFVDADVHLEPDALARVIAEFDRRGVDLLSGVPRQVTVGFWERLLLPMIHFVLLGFLPMWRMRRSLGVGYGAGCGQFFLTTKTAYARSGGHGAIRTSMHDGVKLPRAYRRAGLRTDLVDLTDIAACRMYESGSEVRSGLMKNATEGLAAPRLIVPISLMIASGSILPFGLLIACGLGLVSAELVPFVVASVVLAYLPRIIAARRFRQPLGSALLHPIGIAIFLGLQWTSLYRYLANRPASWRGRNYQTSFEVFPSN